MLRRILLLNKKGFTLLEVLVAIVILMVGLLGMLQAINLAIATNVQNEMRTQAVSIAENQMAARKSLLFDNITTTTQRSLNVPVAMRSTFINYSVAYLVEDISDSKRINIGVRWHQKGNNYEHVVSTIVTKPATP